MEAVKAGEAHEWATWSEVSVEAASLTKGSSRSAEGWAVPACWARAGWGSAASGSRLEEDAEAGIVVSLTLMLADIGEEFRGEIKMNNTKKI